MTRVSPIAVIALASALATPPASAAPDADTSIQCPAEVSPGESASIAVHLQNRECSELSVRLMSKIIGNPNGAEGFDSIGIFGPVVAARLSVPAAQDLLPGTCDTNDFSCDGSAGLISCQTDADCVCRSVSPGTQDLMIDANPPAPASLGGTVANYCVISEWDGGARNEIRNCLIPVPEPARGLQLSCGVVGLLCLFRWRRRKEL